MFQAYLLFPMHQPWNQLVFKKPWFFLLGNSLQKPKCGCSVTMLIFTLICPQRIGMGGTVTQRSSSVCSFPMLLSHSPVRVFR